MKINMYKGLQTEKGVPIAWQKKATMTLEGDSELVELILSKMRYERYAEGTMQFDFEIVEEEEKLVTLADLEGGVD